MSSDLNTMTLVCPDCGAEADASSEVGTQCASDGHVFVNSQVLSKADGAPMLGVILNDNYAVYDIVGRGGMGTVYKAIHRRLDRIVAVKTMNVALAEGEQREEIRARFTAEARALSKLRHPGIVTVYDYGELDGVLYMILEFIKGESLWGLLKREGRLGVERAVPIVKALLEALQVPHHVGLVHRDIKPSNVMLERTGDLERVVLIDFGIAKVNEPDKSVDAAPQTRTGVIVGTPKYMAPEQLKGETLGSWTDQYAVGCLLFRMLSGVSPFDGSRAEVVAAHLRDVPPSLPDELRLQPFDEVIFRAMAKAPGDRFSDNDSFIEAMLDAWVRLALNKDVRITAPISRFATIPEFRLPETDLDGGETGNADGLGRSASASMYDNAEPTETSQTNLTGALADESKAIGPVRVQMQNTAMAILASLFIVVGGLALVDLLSEDTKSVDTSSATVRVVQTQQPQFVGVDAGAPKIAPDNEAPKVISPSPTEAAEDRPIRVIERRAEKESNRRLDKTRVEKTRKARLKRKRRQRSKRASRRTSSRRREGPKATSQKDSRVAGLVRLFDKHLKTCQCRKADDALGKLRKLDTVTANTHEERYKLACELVGFGCQRVEQGKSP